MHGFAQRQASSAGQRPSRVGLVREGNGTAKLAIQRCGIGSSCDCPPRDKLAGIEHDLHGATQAGGMPLPDFSREQMGKAFSFDFAAVRVHAGAAAHDPVAALGARALTVGTDILFRAGEYQPGTPGGDHLLAHELAHVVQQAHGLPHGKLDAGATDPLEKAAGLAADHASPAAEREAEGAAANAAIGGPVPALSPQPLSVARQHNPAMPVAGPAQPRVFFCSKNVAFGLAQHAFFRVGGDGPGNQTYELEHDDNGDHCPCGMQGIPWQNYPEDRDAADAKCEPAPAISASCLAQNYNAYPRGNYCALGPNSNTYARVTAEACGGRGLRPPGRLPGWDDNPPVAGTASPDRWAQLQALGCSRPIRCDDTSTCQEEEPPAYPFSSGYYNG